MKTIVKVVVVLAAISLAIVARVQAAPNLINYQGRLTDAVGQPQTGTKNLTFNIFDAQSLGNLVWGPQTFNGTPLVSGYFNVILGNDTTSRSVATAFAQPSNAWLEIVVNGTALTPRQQVLSAPYAVTAQNADKTAFTMITKTSGYTMTGNEDVVFVNGSSGAFTLTLPSATITAGAPFYGEKSIIIKRTDNTLANVIAIAGTIDGALDWKLHTKGETYRIVRDGAEWKLLEHNTRTPFALDGPMTITATSISPTKGFTTADSITWKREGSLALLSFRYVQVAAGTGGNGSYAVSLPAGLSIDTARAPIYAGTDPTIANAYTLDSTVGITANSGGGFIARAYPYSATSFAVTGIYGGTFYYTWGIGSTSANHLGNGQVNAIGWVRVPIIGWKD